MIKAIEAFCSFMFNADPKMIVCQTYAISDVSPHREYIQEKMRALMRDPCTWWGTLDDSSRRRLAKTIEQRQLRRTTR